MEQFKTQDGKVITYENGQATVVDPIELEKLKADIESRLEEAVIIPDEELLTWAKANYPMIDHTAEIAELDKITTTLEAITPVVIKEVPILVTK